ncbi:unnamed protein product [Choristocarpus tenellus]
MDEESSCRSIIFRMRFGIRMAHYNRLVLDNPPLVAFVRKVNLREKDVAPILRVFYDVDVQRKDSFGIETFFDYFDIDFTEYNKRAFQQLAFFAKFRFPQDSKGRRGSLSALTCITFEQFFVSMYNYGTLIHESLIRFAFDVMANGKEWCNKNDVVELVSLLHTDPARVRETVSSLMGIMDPHNKDKISFSTFRFVCSRSHV